MGDFLMKKLKHLFLILFACMFLFSSIVSAVEPRWINIRRTYVNHDYVDGDTVGIGVQITGVYEISHMDNIDITYERYRGNNVWEEVASWTDLSTTNYVFNFYEELPNIPSGYTYRVRVTADVYRDGICESLDTDYEDTY